MSGFGTVSIGEAARLSGVSARMVRHYEGLGLLPPVARTESGYRQYGDADIHTLRFIKRSRDLGFSMEEIAELVGLWHNRRRASASVKRIAQKHLGEHDDVRPGSLTDMIFCPRDFRFSLRKQMRWMAPAHGI
jgi:DNA-binding transcriptional MerR regulator